MYKSTKTVDKFKANFVKKLHCNKGITVNLSGEKINALIAQIAQEFEL